MRLSPFQGKRVALIDDTLIVGTTLAKTRDLLERRCNSRVGVHVFCCDKKWYCEELVKPDSCVLELDDQRLMTFCTGEVRALSLIPRPYLVDFPISRPIRVRFGDMQCVLSAVEWDAFRISTALQEQNDVEVFTFFPRREIWQDVARGVGRELASCINVEKVRVFARRQAGNYWLQVVPIVTLKSLNSESIKALLDELVDRISLSSGSNLARILEFAESPVSQQRLVQYCLSAAVGHRFMQSVSWAVESNVDQEYLAEETDRHFGPWLHDEMVQVGRHAMHALLAPRKVPVGGRKVPIEPADLPKGVTEWSEESLASVRDPRLVGADKGTRASERASNLVPGFVEIFLKLYDSREIPARQEAQTMGRKVLDAPASEAPNRDRLEMGVPWSLIVEHLTKRCGIRARDGGWKLLSLVLDVCNDLGVAVPITCLKDGVVFRAYRHGEDVRFADSELALAYETVKGFLDGSKRKVIAHLPLEKLLVLMVKLGAATKFLQPLYGTSGVDGTVRIGFYLKGAVAVLSRGPRDRVDRNIWLSEYLVERNVLKRGTDGGFVLGNLVEGNFQTDDAPDRAYELGYILGILARVNGHRGPLDDKAMTLLASCWPPRHAAAALQVELDIFARWYEEKGAAVLKRVNWNSAESISKALAVMLRSEAHEAIHSAKLKFLAYQRRAHEEIVKECTKSLEGVPVDVPTLRAWQSYWNALEKTRLKGELETFNTWIERSALFCWDIAACLSAVEIALCARIGALTKAKPKRSLRRPLQKLSEYDHDMGAAKISRPPLARAIVARFSRVKDDLPDSFDHHKALLYAVDKMQELLPRISGLVDSMEPIVARFGKLTVRHDFRLMLYYDIMDSTATNAVRRGVDAEEYRSNVREFKRYVNERVYRASIVARKNASEIFATNGNVTSTNDCKHIFLSGTFARRHLVDLISILIEANAAWPGVLKRIYTIPCNFAGSGAYRMDVDTEVSGERFWEHWSRLLKGCAQFEKLSRTDLSFFLVGSDELIKGMKIPTTLEWTNQKESTVVSEIEFLMRSTRVRYGNLALRGSPSVAASA